MSDTVLLDVRGAVATVTLNRPDGLNALTGEMKDSLLEAIRGVAADAQVRAVVLTGSGKAFCVGQDLREHAALLDSGDLQPLSTVREHFNPIATLLATMGKPVVAAINGTAAGAGLALACLCDLRVAASGTRYTTAFTGIGLAADSGLSWTLPRLVGYGRAMALLLLAEPFTAEKALEMGLVNAVVPVEQVLPAATELATRLAAGPTLAFAAVKQEVGYAMEASLAQALEREDQLQEVCGRSADHAGAVRSFLAKRVPVFQGS